MEAAIIACFAVQHADVPHIGTDFSALKWAHFMHKLSADRYMPPRSKAQVVYPCTLRRIHEVQSSPAKMGRYRIMNLMPYPAVPIWKQTAEEMRQAGFFLHVNTAQFVLCCECNGTVVGAMPQKNKCLAIAVCAALQH